MSSHSADEPSEDEHRVTVTGPSLAARPRPGVAALLVDGELAAELFDLALADVEIDAVLGDLGGEAPVLVVRHS